MCLTWGTGSGPGPFCTPISVITTAAFIENGCCGATACSLGGEKRRMSDCSRGMALAGNDSYCVRPVAGMGKELENLILENTELLATK